MPHPFALKILRYYRNVEFFRVFDLDDVIKRHKTHFLVNSLKPLAVMPWDDLQGFGLNPEYYYSFDLFFGVFSVGDILKKLTTQLHGADVSLPDYRAWEIPTKSCVARVGINSDGELDLKDISLSTLPWAAQQVIRGRKLSLTQFDVDSGSFIDELEGFPNVNSAHDKSEKKLNFDSLINICDAASEIFLDDDILTNLVGVIVPIRLNKRKHDKDNCEVKESSEEAELDSEDELDKEIDESDSEQDIERNSRKKRRKVDILNSFFLRDLERAALNDNTSSRCLDAYISEDNNSNKRLDIRKNENAKEIIEHLAGHFSHGRWCFPSTLNLAQNQKAAINWSIQGNLEGRNTPLIAVNGPPGTGKTTIIKELLAKNLVQRGIILSSLDRPEDAFEKGFHTYSPEGKDISYRYRKLIPELCNAGIIVASSNNGAVENISKELPLRGALSEEFGEIRYLSEITKSLRFSAKAKDINDWWGLISLPLGKYQNRKIVAQALMWGDKDDTKKEERRQKGAFTIDEWRNKAPKKNSTYSFRDAKKHFKAKLKNIEEGRHTDSREKNILETELFIASLVLHEAWIREVSLLESELKSIASLLSRPSGIPGTVSVALWEVLFMIAPLISTTLASVERMFANVPKESFPFAIIDEAGQALPQSGVGLLMRCKKGLILGDQRQLTPILSLPQSLDEFLQDKEELSEDERLLFGASVSSLQSLADFQSEIGTYFGIDSSSPVWVGLPLTSHRRCDEPMFSISNKISYDNIMEFHTQKRSEISSIGESCWFDVKGEAKNSHWVPSQGFAVQNLLRKLIQANPHPDCFFITPFRAVKDKLQEIVSETFRERPDSEIIKTLRRRVGTIHTFQGREADIVFLVLGCDWSSEGAADWAGGSPNLCNVAITRAKRFLYVIGDVDLWHRRGVFSDLQKGLVVKTINEIG